MRSPLGLAAGWVAAQGEDVVDPRGGDLIEDLPQPADRLADARQVRHRLDAEVPLDRRRDLDSAVSRRAAGAVGDGHIRRLILAEVIQSALQLGLALLGLGREELEGEDRPALLEDLVDTHRARLRAKPRAPCIFWRDDLEPDGQSLLPADRVLDVQRRILPVGTRDRGEQRQSSTGAEPAPLLERTLELACAGAARVVDALPLRHA